MVRSALFFCRNERADAHLPRFQGVGLHIIIYCLNLLGSALQVHSAVRTNQYAHFVQTIHLHKQAISGVKWIISLAHVKPRPFKCLQQLRFTIVRRYNDTFDFSHFFQLSNSLLEGSKLRCTPMLRKKLRQFWLQSAIAPTQNSFTRMMVLQFAFSSVSKSLEKSSDICDPATFFHILIHLTM